MAEPVTEQRVLASRDALPAFPRVVLQIMQTLEDPDASLSLLSRQVETDPVMAARVLSLCNRASNGAPGRAPVSDVFTALSLVGMARVRSMTTTIKLAGFMQDFAPTSALEYYWSHSLACAVCGVEVAHYTHADVCVDASLIACLLHDIGQLWLHRFEPEGMQLAMRNAETHDLEIDVAEREVFGVDHATVGGWLARAWGLSDNICKGIIYHHAPQDGLPEPLVAVVHVSEVLNHALNLSNAKNSHVRWVSEDCCALLGMDWGDDSQGLFGRIEARSRHAFGPYMPTASGA
jgi:putative nucleotidyltransferase with HDIG domain